MNRPKNHFQIQGDRMRYATAFGQQCRRARLKMKLTQTEFGELLGRQVGRDRPITARTVSYWERGLREPRTPTLDAFLRLCEEMDVRF